MTLSAWCNIPNVFAFGDLMEAHRFLNLGTKEKKIIHGIIMVTCWCIWKGRDALESNFTRHYGGT
ncbi:hypothetical protein HanIR_Chr12g0602351 [Helianthus annuus]|nr:hypothetical protein HanIR_Chr12g0602351 [Helianthus annuus]